MKVKFIDFLNKILSLFDLRIKKIGGRYSLDRNIFFDERKVFKKLFNNKKELTIIDIGCYHGEFIDTVEKIFPGSQYFCFEPEDNSFRYLQSKYRRNKNVILENCVIGDEHNEVTFNVIGDDSTGNSMLTTTDEELIHKRIRKKQITLDSFIEEHNIKNVDILKIDTQGYERECLLGALSHLEKGTFKSLKVEVMFQDTYVRPSSFLEIESIILKYGYRLRDICFIKKSYRDAKSLVCDVIYSLNET
tara:strand:+ start:485 stop:1225 length:741 start_codon:yes stop_codon:yes gene_type:complete